MHLGIYHEPVHTDGRTFDTYGPYARYVLAFARHFEQVTVFAPATMLDTYFSGCPLEAPNVTVAPLPWFTTHARAYRRAMAIGRVFRCHAGSLDVINCRGTAPLGYLLWWMTRKRNVPFLYHFASDPFDVIRTSPRYKGAYGAFARLAYGAEFSLQRHIMRGNYSFASGRLLSDRLRRYTPLVEPVLDSSLIEGDYYLRTDCCNRPPVRILYVGGLRPGKGLDVLLEAGRRLQDSGRDFVLEFVGDGPLRKNLLEQANRLGVSKRFVLRGTLVMGPQLNEAYDSADIFVLPSLSEGSPRVVLEALAHSLPVVATDVGNVAELLDGGRRGVLAPKGDAAALAAGIARIIDDAAFRRQCIQEGYTFAREHGLEAFVARMAAKAREMVQERRGPQEEPA